MNDEELEKRIGELRVEIVQERIDKELYGMGYTREGRGAIRPLKRDLARALTVQNERRNR
jgi:ribosomal protein L29